MDLEEKKFKKPSGESSYLSFFVTREKIRLIEKKKNSSKKPSVGHTNVFKHRLQKKFGFLEKMIKFGN